MPLVTVTAMDAFHAELEAKLHALWVKAGHEAARAPTIEFEPGNRYIKIWRVQDNFHHVYGFVDGITGDLFRAASRKHPAKSAKGNVFAPDALTYCGPCHIDAAPVRG